MSDDLSSDSSPWFLGLALVGASALLMAATGAAAALGLLWLVVA